MRNIIVKFENNVLSDFGTVERPYFSELSSELLFDNVAGIPPVYKKRIKKHKDLTIPIRIINNRYNRDELEEKIRILKAQAYSEKVGFLQLNKKYANAILENVEVERFFNTALVSLKYLIVDGYFMSDLKFANLGQKFTIGGDIPTSEVEVEILEVTGAESISVNINGNNKKLVFSKLTSGRKLTIDFKNKRAYQGQEEVPLDIDYDFFEIPVSNNVIISTRNNVGRIKYREVYL